MKKINPTAALIVIGALYFVIITLIKTL